LAGVTYPNPRKQFIDDLQRTISQSVANHKSVVIIGNYNEALSKNSNLMASICSKHGLFNVHTHFHGANADIPTYARGSTRLDYGVASPTLKSFVYACGYNLFNEYIHSDHRAQFLDLNLKSFFGHATPRLARPGLRFVSSASSDIKKFIRKMYAHLADHKAFHQYHDLQLDVDILEEPWRQANKLDRILGQAFAIAEKHCSKHPQPPWSAKLHHVSLKVRYWKTALTGRKTKVPQTTDEIWPGKSGQQILPPYPAAPKY
jgi:hypothetical protein